MHRLLVRSLLAAGLLAMVPSLEAAPSRPGSACADAVAAATCSANTVTGAATITNCGTGIDTFIVIGTVFYPSGSVAHEETLSVPLQPGKSFTYDLVKKLPSSTTAGTYKFTMSADAQKGTGYDTTSLTLKVPCP